MSDHKTNFERIIESLFQLPSGKKTFKFPWVDRSTHPPTEHKFEVVITEQDARDILSIVKRAANKQRINNGQDILFNDPIDYPDPDAEIRRRNQKFMSDLLVKAESIQDDTERRKLLKEIRMTARELRPSMSITKFEWDKIVGAFKKVSPQISEDEILAAFGK